MRNGLLNGKARELGPDRALLRSTSGQSILEVALLTPFLLLLLLGAVDVGRYAYFAIGVGNAAHAGAFYASQNAGTASTSSTNQTAVQDAACEDFAGQDSPCGLTVSITNGCQCDNHGAMSAASSCAASACPNEVPGMVTTVTVTASGTFSPIFNYPAIPSFTVTRSATMIYGP
jgi:Flp pilus assembly protein TadG